MYDVFCVCRISSKDELSQDDFMFFLTGGVGLENQHSNPASDWLSDKSWDELCRLEQQSSVFKGIR